MTLTETLRTDWPAINTGKRLRCALLHAARRLRELGHAALADTWESRVKRMPRQRYDKEWINIVLIQVNDELEAIGIKD